ncbi:hypothetical protein [Salinisphaera sp.]|uniref:hypothetical protein n=1 Tax=Salinisphaera sp. TaxID=1914330 RepID=UPI000C35759C|nr:hypothetical protein [Salinisphaera sp.]MBS62447.1 hypothetical protein [Salinisphaera sp.]
MQVRSVVDCCDTALPDPLGLVRRSTQRLHASVEHDTPMARLVACDCTLEDYRAALKPLARIYAALDDKLHAARCWRPCSVGPYRARLPLLQIELERWCATATVAPVSAPPLDGVAAYLGVRYVIDGAQFGHRVIAASLARSAAAAVVAQGSGFWATSFVSTAEWRRLCQALRHLGSRSEAASAARAARRTFELFSRELHRGSPRAA